MVGIGSNGWAYIKKSIISCINHKREDKSVWSSEPLVQA
jgi:hypothetical protein